MTPEPPVSLTVEALATLLPGARRLGEQRWMARCPAHEDHRASLSVGTGEDGRILLHCFAGCEVEAIVRALGLDVRRLFPHRPGPRCPRSRPLHAGRVVFDRLVRMREVPSPERMREELLFVGRLLLGGLAEFSMVADTFHADFLRTFPLRIIYLAMAELTEQHTQRRWFSPLALARQVRLSGGGPQIARDVFFWCRAAVAEVRGDHDGQ